MYKYYDIANHRKGGAVERTILLNPAYSKEEIASFVKEKRFDQEIISLVQAEGIFLTEERTFKADSKGLVADCPGYHKFEGYHQICLRDQDEITFYPDGTFSIKYHYSHSDFLHDCCDSIVNFFKKIFF